MSRFTNAHLIQKQEISNPAQMWQLQENGVLHTDGLTEVEANEMKLRHERFFPNEEWTVFYMQPNWRH